MDGSRLLRRLDEAWDSLLESYSGLPHARMTEPGTIGAWSLKDTIAHVTSWEEESLTHLPLIIAGERTPRYSVVYGGIDAFNARVIARTRGLPLAEVLRQRDETHRRLLAFVRGIPGELLLRESRVRRRLRLDTYGHYARHAAAIVRWRRRQAPLGEAGADGA
jgi:hypothetical protein